MVHNFEGILLHIKLVAEDFGVSQFFVGQSMLDVSDNFVPWEYGDGIHSSHTIMSLLNKILGKIHYSCEMNEYYIVIL